MFKQIILGTVQGLTEFLPVSSSGHLVLFNNILDAGGDVALYTILHLGTVFAVCVYFYRDIIELLKDISRIKAVLLACFVTGVIAICFKDIFESLFSNIVYVATALMCNGIILLLTRSFMQKADKEKTGIVDALIMGVVQALAVIPGISRSGATITALSVRGVKKEEAFRFSFVAAIPLIGGAFLMELKDLGSMSECVSFCIKYSVPAFTSFVTGLCSLKMLSYMINKSKFHIFGWYCIIVSIIVFILYLT